MDEDIKTKNNAREKNYGMYVRSRARDRMENRAERWESEKMERRQTMRGCHLIWNKQQNKLS